MSRFLTVVVVLALAAGVGWYYLHYGTSLPPAPDTQDGPEPTNFIDCMRHYPTFGSQPRTCTNGLGITYTEDVGNGSSKVGRISVTLPGPNAVVSSPLSIRGNARGSWYNDGVFTVELLDGSGNLLGKTLAQAQTYWDTSSSVSFKASLPFSPPRGATVGRLVFLPGVGSETPLVVPVLFR